MLIEVATFRLAAGAGSEVFAAAERALATVVLYLQPGLVRRTAARNEDGEWLTLTMWQSREDAERAASATAGHPVRRAADALVDPASMVVRRYTTLD